MAPAEHGTAEGTRLLPDAPRGFVAATTAEVVRMPSLDLTPQLKATVSHAERLRTGLDSQTGLKCSWLDICFHIPGTAERSASFGS